MASGRTEHNSIVQSDAEIQEAIAYGAEVRLWSTILNGSQYDLDQWKTEIDGILAHVAEAQEKTN